MDVSPWPDAPGFADADLWWGYLWGCDERARLEHLLVAALLDTDIRGRLLDHDPALLRAFHLSDRTIMCICAIQDRGLNSFTAELLNRLALSSLVT